MCLTHLTCLTRLTRLLDAAWAPKWREGRSQAGPKGPLTSSMILLWALWALTKGLIATKFSHSFYIRLSVNMLPRYENPCLINPSSSNLAPRRALYVTRYNALLWPSALNLVSCKTQHLTDQKMSSPVFPCRYSSCPASVTSPLYDVLGQNNHIFSESSRFQNIKTDITTWQMRKCKMKCQTQYVVYFWKDNCSRISSESRTVIQALEFHNRHLIWSVLYYLQSTFLKLKQLKV